MGTPLTVSGNLVLTNGKLITSETNLLTLQAINPPTGSATSYVQGPLAVQVNSTAPAARTFAVGDATAWRPVVLSGLTTSGTQTFTATVISGTPTATLSSPLTLVNSVRYARVQGPLPTTASVQLSYGADDVIGNLSSAVVAQASAPAGQYVSRGGAPATTPPPACSRPWTLPAARSTLFWLTPSRKGRAEHQRGQRLPRHFGHAHVVELQRHYSGLPSEHRLGLPGRTRHQHLSYPGLHRSNPDFYLPGCSAHPRRTHGVFPARYGNRDSGPDATLTATSATTFCGSGTLTLTAPAGTGSLFYQFLRNGQPIAGATSATYTTTVTSSASYSVTVSNTSGCSSTSAPIQVTVNPATSAGFSYASASYCTSGTTNPTPTLTTGATAGTFSSTTGLALDAATGAINLSASTPDTYTVTNSVGGTCPSSATFQVTITAPATAGFSYATSTFCTSASGTVTPALATGASAGTFTSTAGLTLDAATGAITPGTSTPGTYTITNTVAAAGGCAAATATATVTITAPALAGFSYPATSYCTSGTTNPTPVLASGASAGTFSSATGLSIDAATGTINLAASTPGTYTVTNTVAAAGGCAAVTATATLTITAPATAGFSYASTSFCSGDATNPTPALATGATAGTFSSTPGLTINATTGAITLSSSTPGTYTVTNTVAAAGGCSAVTATTTVTINATPAQPTVTASYSGATTTLTSSATTGNQWYLNGTAIPGATNQTYVVSAAAQYGNYTVVTTSAQGCASLPSQPLVVTTSQKPLAGSSLTIYPNPTPTAA
ncbi:hypothetical protein MUN84_15015 [Hymenobacter sp. 5516J-16]|uniref:Ig-like domain-containing protein n=1 Tax=Hymenobacter sp. 5516J-16 TaxID=2932253 RepID=UPI001FD4ED2C|nr:hypothetical protein [Hymenobacter sp. 5516J-16]UOQ75928.1 hypothetical protein MUN84_15015 [Hymenobacter sp. 5516J-16]